MNSFVSPIPDDCCCVKLPAEVSRREKYPPPPYNARPTHAVEVMSDRLEQTHRRRTVPIISHPSAGKTTLREKLLLFGGAIQTAGSVKSRKATRHATSDWMALEKERGISVTSSVMQFPYA